MLAVVLGMALALTVMFVIGSELSTEEVEM